MANLALQMRLGIRRGWRVKMFNDIGLYTPSLVHCMFVFVLLRVKSLRLNVWVVSYYILFLLNKLTIYAFFWFLPTRASTKLVGKYSGVNLRVGVAGSKLYLSRSTLVSISAVPAKSYWLRVRCQNGSIAGRGGVSSATFSKL